MALDNLISIQFTEQEVQHLKIYIEKINKILEGKVVNLSPEERKQYGSIADRNKLLVDKCKHYMDHHPETLPRIIDKTEFDADYKARNQVETPYRSLQRVAEKLRDTKTLLDHDNYQAALSYYKYIKYLASENEPGTTSIYQDLKKHYQNAGRPAKEAEHTTTKPTSEE